MDDHIRGVLGEQPVALLGGGECEPGLHLGGDVATAADEAHDHPFRVPDGACGDGEPAVVAGFGGQPRLEAHRPAGPEDRELPVHLLGIVGMPQQSVDAVADEVLRLPPENVHHGRRHPFQDARNAASEDQVGGILGEQPILAAAGCQRLLRLDLRRNVAEGGDGTATRAVHMRGQRRGVDQQPQPAPVRSAQAHDDVANRAAGGQRPHCRLIGCGERRAIASDDVPSRIVRPARRPVRVPAGQLLRPQPQHALGGVVRGHDPALAAVHDDALGHRRQQLPLPLLGVRQPPRLRRPTGHVAPGERHAVTDFDGSDVEVAFVGQQLVGVDVVVEQQRLAGLDDADVALEQPALPGVARQQAQHSGTEEFLARQPVVVAGGGVGVGEDEVDHAAVLVAHGLQEDMGIEHRIERREPAVLLVV